uniref:Uncharacterized protein n=1 Tax=Meloidogyne enterolobii TaxID=390850 RepID=A0A6V7V3T5_MELEN|nr:unnamed protein product [Meloidogyne enterolobii]
MTSTNYFNETFKELMENEDHKNIEDGIDIGGNKEEINVWNQKDLKIQKQSAKTKRNLNPHPTACSICERIASGYLFYGVICCYSCKHFFNRCITSQNKYKCENDGNCNLSPNINVCKSCRFDKCILKGMYIQTTKGREPEEVVEIQTMIQNKRRELASKGKYVQGKSNNCAVEETNFVDLQKSLIAKQNTQLIDYLLTIEQHACRIRDSPVGIQDLHYNSSLSSLATLLMRKENLIAMKPEYVIGKQNFPEPVFNPNKGIFSSLPKPMTDLLLIIVDTARTMPFFDKLDLADKICLITTIALPLKVFHSAYYSSRKKSEIVVLPNQALVRNAFKANIYKEDATINKFKKKLFVDSMGPFNRLQLSKEEFVLLRAIIFSHFVSTGLSQHGRQLLLTEAENYSDILMKMLQKRYGPLPVLKDMQNCFI